MDEKLNSLLEYVKLEGRVCPLPNHWNALWQMLPNRTQKSSGGWEPPLPLILAAWWESSALLKMERLAAHINYAAKHGDLDEVDQFLRNLIPDQWAYGDGTTEWAAYKAR
ncbi:MAG: hypothetical protein HQL26_11125 [Candidatus Omnitrophica bacterium]|nr:hypothetical protein [Candidatus Omnitrophota bacterium]